MRSVVSMMFLTKKLFAAFNYPCSTRVRTSENGRQPLGSGGGGYSPPPPYPNPGGSGKRPRPQAPPTPQHSRSRAPHPQRQAGAAGVSKTVVKHVGASPTPKGKETAAKGVLGDADARGRGGSPGPGGCLAGTCGGPLRAPLSTD